MADKTDLVIAATAPITGAGNYLIPKSISKSFQKSSALAAEGMRALADAMNKAREEIEKVGIPSVDSQRVLLENPQLIYQYSPELEQVLPLNETNLKNIQNTAKYSDAQFQALKGLEEQTRGGLNIEEQAILNQLRQGTANQEEQVRQAIAQQELAQGFSGSGIELQKQLENQFQQDLANQEKYGQIGSSNIQAKLDALNRMGGLASSIRDQEFGEKADIAQAQDSINRFNIANQLNVQQRNIGAKNIASQNQAELRQQLENQRAQTSNQQQQINKELLAQDYQNKLNKYRALLGQTQAETAQTAQMGINAAQNRAAQNAALLSLLGSTGQAGAQMYANQNNAPKTQNKQPQVESYSYSSEPNSRQA